LTGRVNNETLVLTLVFGKRFQNVQNLLVAKRLHVKELALLDRLVLLRPGNSRFFELKNNKKTVTNLIYKNKII
jgi:hypothetical protein